jgi:predicted CXXCH cytochrome family protein
MKRFKDVEHLVRLAALFLGGVLVFAVARAQFVPEGFGTLGHYRAGAVDEARETPIRYAGQQACARCHSVRMAGASDRHAPIACESCHGPLAAHAADPVSLKPVRPDGRQLCIRCHAKNTGKPARQPTVDIADHAGDERCTSCHEPHNPKQS